MNATEVIGWFLAVQAPIGGRMSDAIRLARPVVETRVDWTPQAVVALVAVAATLCTYALSRRADRQLRRAELIRAYTADFYASSEMTVLFHRLDAEAIERDKNGVADAHERVLDPAHEPALIRLLDYLNSVGAAYVRGALPIQDLAGTTIGYMTFRVWRDESVQSFLAEVRANDEAAGFMGAGFQHFYSLAAALDAWSRTRGGAPWAHSEVLHSGWRHRLERGSRASTP